ncbi:MAG: glycerol-3-phosphate acyltransferase [Dehalococcoidales bacterium]|jgi:glycerol-3-phosphate acyltransferase PlsY|nr:glycerol-3-phosphate acyltransferase [Dehalococcoidales bacterium]MDX9986177.1 glycerol-3-phosphate acyltransferase [Dehalococcoidales bacterium]NLE89697.1 glycerol-3-phosphate acyltransferase [Dehalococcoidales bacterium]
MNEILASILAVIAAYFIGSLPSAYIAGRLVKGVDIRTIGSHNMGAMNTFYSLGFIPGVMVLAADILKGAAAVAMARFLCQLATGNETIVIVEMIAGLFVVIGHNYPIWLKFKGGKGGATLIGVIIFLMPWCLPIGFGTFLVILAITRFPTLSYGLAMISFPFVAWLIYDRVDYIIYSAVMLLIPYLSYIPRIVEMKSKGGSWSRVIKRKNLKDRL